MSRVARMFSDAVDASGKTQYQIAEEVGFTTTSIISLLKNGRAKIPVGRIDQIAKALDLNEGDLLRSVLKEYDPDLFKIVERVYNDDKLSSVERDIIERIRANTKSKSYTLKMSHLSALDAFAKSLIR